MKKTITIALLYIFIAFGAKAQDKKTAFTFGIGPVLAYLQQPAIADNISDYYGTEVKVDPNGALTLQGEWYMAKHFSLFGEFSTNNFAASGSNYSSGYTGSSSSSGYSESARSEIKYHNLTLNGRWNIMNRKFMPYIDAGFGITTGTHYMNTTDASPLFGFAAQLGVGAKLYFGKFGIFAETKTSFVLNTKDIDGEIVTAPAKDANMALQVLHCGICFGF